jgi:uncharacterized membrane protein
VSPVATSTRVMRPVGAAGVLGAMKERAWSLGLGCAMTVWAVALLAVVRDHYVNFRLARYDLGNMVQAVWSTAHGRPLELTDATGEQMVRLGSHVDPILVALAPLWVLAPTPLLLVAVQIAAVASGALPVFWLARRHTGSERVAGVLALAYLAYPWIAWTAVDAFHPVTIAIPFLLLCIWFLDTDRLVPFAACAVTVMSTGELMGVAIAALGIWYALAHCRRRVGALIAAGGAVWTFVALYVIVPSFYGGSSRFYGFYEHVGGSPFGILRTAVTDPLAIVSSVTSGHDALYVALLAVPLGGIFVLAPGLAAAAIPQLAANLLADWSSTTDPHAHYVAGILPFLFGAAAIGLGRLSETGRLRTAILALTLSLASSLVVGPWPGALGGQPDFYRLDQPSERVDAVREAVSFVPPDAPVSSTNRIGSHLSARRYIYSVPVLGHAQWVVLDMSDSWMPNSERGGGAVDPGRLRRLQRSLAGSREWETVFARSGVFVFRKVHT